jgi:hypothetical protein
VSKADLLDFPELPSVPADTPVGSNTPQDDDDDIGKSYIIFITNINTELSWIFLVGLLVPVYLDQGRKIELTNPPRM